MKQISDKRKQKLLDELPIRIEIIKRAGGTPVRIVSLPYVICAGGRCEECGAPPLHPEYPLTVHHKKKQSQGGKLEKKEDGEALCIKCHNKTEGIKVVFSEPQWGRRK